MKKINLVKLKNFPIYKQLLLEEALLRTDENNWCIINEGTPPAIVMGIAGQKENLINKDLLKRNPIPVIKRFSGGGCVIVNEDSLFITFIFSKKTHNIELFPEKIHAHMENFYKECFQNISLKENDYVIDQKKCGGNAQYIKKDRWLHHTSFLWDYKKEDMDLLLLPSKQPKYRENRQHNEFLCKLKNHFSSKEEFQTKIEKNLSKHFNVEIVQQETILEKQYPVHRQRTKII